jgi:hypothetical protein
MSLAPKSVLKENHSVRSDNYNPTGRNNYWEFEIPEVDEHFHSKHYSPLVYEEIPYMEPGTLEYDDFWDEQDRRCLEGYAPVVDGVQYPRITGPHYFYLNNLQIMMLREGDTKKRLHYPYYRVLDHMLFLEIEKAGLLGYGLIIGKARRMGLSYIGDCMTIWNMLFSKDNEVAIGAGKEDKALELFQKVQKSLENIREEYKVSYKKSKNFLKFTYRFSENKVVKEEGIGSELTVKTFFSDPSAFEGGSYSFFIFEEIGLQDNLIKSYKASEPCFMEGGIQFGVPMLYGTGGEVDKGSKDMKTMWENPGAYNLKKIFIPAYMYYPGRSNEDGENSDEQPNFFDIRTGRTDEIKALKDILERRRKASKSKEGYIKEIQSRPTEEGHIFLKTSGGQLNRLLLNNQLQTIYDTDPPYKVKKGRLEWVYNPELEFSLSRCHTQKERDKIHIANNSGVKFIEDATGTVRIIAKPINEEGMPYLADIGGVDSYDQTTEEKKGSFGASVIYRCFTGMSQDYNMPVAFIQEKGDASSDDLFYHNSLKLAVYYRTKMLVEYSKVMIINYFEDTRAEKYLCEKPILRSESIANKGRQRYGVHMTTEMKNIVTRLLKHEVNKNCGNIWSDEIILDLIDYGDENTDIAMALGMCLIQKLDMFDYIAEDLERYDQGDVLMDMAFYEFSNGQVRENVYGQTDVSVNNIEVFDPRKHLEGEERKKYLNFMAMKEKQRQEALERNRELQTKQHDDIFVEQVKEEIEKRKQYE